MHPIKKLITPNTNIMKTYKSKKTIGGSLSSGCKRWISILLLAFIITSCSDILDVDTPTLVDEEDLQDPAQAELLVRGAIADFESAFDTYILMGGVLGNELGDATFTASRWPVDRRTVVAADDVHPAYFSYSPLSTARWSADNIIDNLQQWTDQQVENRQSLLATAAAYSGYSHILLGEGFCTMAIDQSPELSREEVWEMAIEKFDLAIAEAQSSGNDEILNMAYVGRARANLNLGNTAAAASDAQQVDEGFSITMTASDASGRRQNSVFAEMNAQNITITEQFRDLEVQGEPDVRVPVVDENAAPAGVPVFTTPKYDSFGAEIPIARWEEAQLIIAEHEGGQTAVNIINDLRAEHGLPEFSSTDEQEIQDQVIEERQRELFLESHHLYDVTRYNLDLFPAPGTPFPNGGTYADQRCLPLPDVERDNNPNI
jgi:hypothetical protein